MVIGSEDGENNAVRLPKMGKRRVVYSSVRSVMIYAAPVWYRVMRIGRYKNIPARCSNR